MMPNYSPTTISNLSGVSHEELVDFNELELVEAMGAGHSGTLYRATWHGRGKGKTVAVKHIRMSEAENIEDFLANFDREMNIVRRG